MVNCKLKTNKAQNANYVVFVCAIPEAAITIYRVPRINMADCLKVRTAIKRAVHPYSISILPTVRVQLTQQS